MVVRVGIRTNRRALLILLIRGAIKIEVNNVWGATCCLSSIVVGMSVVEWF
jgi:hypothetical protein